MFVEFEIDERCFHALVSTLLAGAPDFLFPCIIHCNNQIFSKLARVVD